MGARSSVRPSCSVAEAIEHAERELLRARHVLEQHNGDLRTLREAVDGAARLTRSLAATVDRLAAYAPATVPDDAVASDLVADLNAFGRCLTTGSVLLEPAVEDLHALGEAETAALPHA